MIDLWPKCYESFVNNEFSIIKDPIDFGGLILVSEPYQRCISRFMYKWHHTRIYVFIELLKDHSDNVPHIVIDLCYRMYDA